MHASLRSLSDEVLKASLKNLVRSERKIMGLIIEHIAEAERRKFYLKDYGSLYEYLIKDLGYSEPAAYRRMQTAYAFREIPQVKDGLVDGSLSLSQVCMVQRALRLEEKTLGKLCVHKKNKIFSEVRRKTTAETQKILDQHLSVQSTRPRVQEVHKQDDSVELFLKIPQDLYQNLKRVVELYSHIDPAADWVEVLRLMAKDVIELRDPLVKEAKKARKAKARKASGQNKKASGQYKEASGQNQNAAADFSPSSTQCLVEAKVDLGVKADRNKRSDRNESLNKSENRGRNERADTNAMADVGASVGSNPSPGASPSPTKRKAIPASVRRHIFQRDHGRCQYPVNGHSGQISDICGSRFQVEIDHLHEVFAGGSNEPENLRLLCRQHNIYRYQKDAGLLKERWVEYSKSESHGIFKRSARTSY